MASSALARMRSRWQAWSARFALLQAREKYLVIGAALFAVGFGGYSLWVEPVQIAKQRLHKSIAQQSHEQAQLQAQIAALLQRRGDDPDAGNRVLLAQLNDALGVADRDLHSFDAVLLSPQQAPALLQTLLSRHRGLTLLRLATLPPQPLLPVAAAGDTSAPDAAKAVKTAAADKPANKAADEAAAGGIYKHGIEIKIAGGYHDLLAYVNDIEHAPQKLLWGSLRLSSPSDKYPVGELTLTLYSLSLEATWLAV